MVPLLLGIILLLLAALLVFQVLGARRPMKTDLSPIEHAFKSVRDSYERSERIVREEIAGNRQEVSGALLQSRTELNAGSKSLRDEVAATLKGSHDSMVKTLGELGHTFRSQLASMSEANLKQTESLRATVEARLKAIQDDNAMKLEQMRQTVDEKLHATLEQRLSESFKIVSERLDLVHKGLGEMQTLASGVGDLKKVLTNIKTRGNWGEVQLGNLLEQMLTPDQYEANVQTNTQSAERVDFAVKLPGKDTDGKCVWLPIDAKFPQEDYQRLIDAADRGDVEQVATFSAALETRICFEAKKIKEKYINAPHTTDFAILFLPTEGLFAEVLRKPGLCDGLLRDHRIVLAGPTTLAALLSSLQMGFRTLAIEKRSSEVWQLLGAVRTQFGKFGDVLEKVQKKLQEASNTIDDAKTRTRVINNKLKDVQELPAADADGFMLLGGAPADVPTDSASE